MTTLTLKKDGKMNSAVPDLTPPGKPAKPPKSQAEFKGEDKKAEKKEKVAKTPADPNAPKKERAPRSDYGYRPDAVIGLLTEKGDKYRGQRKDWYDQVRPFAGKTVAEFVAAAQKEGGESARGWLRFFVQDGSATLTGGTVQAPAKTKAEEKPAAPPA